MPALNHDLTHFPLSVFVDIDRKLATSDASRRMPLHQGKTSFQPAVPLRAWAPDAFELQPHQHAPPIGVRCLRERIASHHARHFDRAVEPAQVLLHCGASHAIASILGSILDPGDEVLVLSPQWLFATGLVAAAAGRAVEVPVFLELASASDYDLDAALRRHVTPRTRAIYFNTPNNPTGICLTAKHLQCLIELAHELDLWLIADNAYEIYDFSPRGFRDVSALPGASERTFAVHSFSKTFAIPGYRIAYSVSPKAAALTLQKRALYSVYAVATPSQYAAYEAIASYDRVAAAHRSGARAARDVLENRLRVPHTRVEGGLYTALDLRGWRNAAVPDFIDACIARGVSLAPGIAFGACSAGYARLCFSAVTEGELPVAIELINDVYERG